MSEDYWNDGGVSWIPVPHGKRRGKCSTRAWKTHNKKAHRYLRRHKPMSRMVTGYFAYIGGISVVEG